MYSRKPRAVSNMHVFAACEIDFANKQLVSPSFSWNTTLLETSLVNHIYWWFTDIYMLKEKQFLECSGSWNVVKSWKVHVENNLL